MSKRIAVKLAAVLLLLTGGCMWNKPGSGSLASIVIDEIPLSQIRSETMQVFAKEYYRAPMSMTGRLFLNARAPRKTA